jgi:molybdate-binding protein
MVAAPMAPIPAVRPAAEAVRATAPRKANLLGSPPELERVLIAGCDPAMSVLAAHAARSGTNLVLASCNSSEALRLLKKGRIHVAGTHLRNHVVRRSFAAGEVSVVTFASWEEGLVVAAGNPLQIRSVADLVRRKVRIVNRENGAGSRILLDEELAAAGVPVRRVSGYESVVRSHMGAAWHVRSGLADACIATGVAARAIGLDFLPIVSERYDLVVRREFASLPAIERLFDVLQKSALRRELELVGGYDTRATGRAVS